MSKNNISYSVEEGMVVGIVSTNTINSDCEFMVCSEDEFLQMTDDEAHKALVEAMWESGYLDVYFKPNKDDK